MLSGELWRQQLAGGMLLLVSGRRSSRRTQSHVFTAALKAAAGVGLLTECAVLCCLLQAEPCVSGPRWQAACGFVADETAPTDRTVSGRE